MALQTSGAISLLQLQNEFGGSSPISLSEYRRGGSYVPSTKTVSTTIREPSSGYLYSQNNPISFWSPYYSLGNIFWNGTAVAGEGAVTSTQTSYTTGGWTYHRGPVGAGSYYKVYRTKVTTSTVSINTGVPSSGSISLGDFYGSSDG